MKATNSKWLYLKIGMYVILLYSVVSVMRYVKTNSFSGNVDMLMGSPSQIRTLDWCSNSVQAIFVVPSSSTIRDPKAIQELCHLAYSSYQADEIKSAEWSPFLKSLDEKGAESTLDVDKTISFLKQGSMIYKVEGLKNKLAQFGVTSVD